MTVKEFRTISASTIVVLVPTDDVDYDIYHSRTNETYIFADDKIAEEREIDFVDAVQDEDCEDPFINVYTK